MLTLWFDYADELLDPDPEMATRSRAAHARPPAVDKRPLLQRINALMRGYVTRLPAYQWQTALSQVSCVWRGLMTACNGDHRSC